MPPSEKSFASLRRMLKPGTKLKLTWHHRPEVRENRLGEILTIVKPRKRDLIVANKDGEHIITWPHRNDIVIHSDTKFDFLGHRGDLACSYEVTP